MEEAEERMAALKRAYADVILNMAKESAARIMASEQRALRFKHDLHRMKEEAVGTLVRVKGILDSKVKDAEREVSVQGRKIQELEARLAESESTVARLRTELSRVEAGREGSEKAEPCRSPQQEEVQKEGLPETNGPPPVLMRCQNNIKKVEAEEPLQGGGGERTLKYTFRRKRKRGLPATSPDKLENPAGAAPSRDSRRIVQVARQLISLSEKKW